VLDSGFPVFYRQQRVGRGGKQFDALKFRTMIREADQAGPSWASPNDPRVTTVGRLLRPTALDELPQVLNILRGEMSFVGPRALAASEVESLRPHHPRIDERFAVPAGLTGLAQLYASRDDMEEKLQLDLEYIECSSIWLDMRLMVRSVVRTVGGRWDKGQERNKQRVDDEAVS
jgi:lipopolysaccharide/colanic/teichoic acid biosynthesis glycosyltransferase